MRISIGIAWLVIVAAEMLVGGTGIGYFVWNEWNNLSIANILSGIGLFTGRIHPRVARVYPLAQAAEAHAAVEAGDMVGRVVLQP